MSNEKNNTTNAGREAGPYIASNIGFGLPTGLFFKVEMTTNDGPSIYTKVGGCHTESEAREYAIKRYAVNLERGHGLRETRVREIGQFQAVLFTAPIDSASLEAGAASSTPTANAQPCVVQPVPAWHAFEHTGRQVKLIGRGWGVNGPDKDPLRPELPERIADCYGPNSETHARLIAAAPDLLAFARLVESRAPISELHPSDLYTLNLRGSEINSLRALLATISGNAPTVTK